MRRFLVGSVFLAMVMLAAAAAQAGGSRQEASLAFTETSPATSTGTQVDIDYVNPADPAGKPPAVRRVILKLADGARFNTRAPQRCHASDAQLTILGEAACPPGSKVGEGVVTVDTGVPGPARFLTVDIDFINNLHQLIYVNTVRGTLARTIIRAQVTPRRIITDTSMLPGTPPDGGAIDTVHTFDPPFSRTVAGHTRNYVTTPPDCPAGGTWTNVLRFRYADGVAQRVENEVPCA